MGQTMDTDGEVVNFTSVYVTLVVLNQPNLQYHRCVPVLIHKHLAKWVQISYFHMGGWL